MRGPNVKSIFLLSLFWKNSQGTVANISREPVGFLGADLVNLRTQIPFIYLLLVS